MIDISTKESSPGCIRLSEDLLPTGIVYKQKNLIYNGSNWHKFVIKGAAKLDRDSTLKALIDYVHPLDLIPVHFVKTKKSSQFIARNCGQAIEKFCHNNLLVANPFDPDNPFFLTIYLKFSTTSEIKIDVQANIQFVLGNRYNSSTKTLDLSNFSKDTDLTEFCPLSQPKIMYFILHIVKMIKPQKLVLTNNEIKLLKPLETLADCPVSVIDLRNNLIGQISEFKVFRRIPELQELYLDKNPICNNYADEFTYFSDIKNYCMHLWKLDGVKTGLLPIPKQNYLCDVRLQNVIDLFLEYYFTAYDSMDRASLKSLYHQNAMFSMTVSQHLEQKSTPTSRLKHYKALARNLKLLPYMRNNDGYYTGVTSIVNLIGSFPRTEHDIYRFKVDLIHYTTKYAVIVVFGVFKEIGEGLLDNDRFFSFQRQFTLGLTDGEFLITNELFHLSNALTAEENKAFDVDKPKIEVPIPKTTKQQKEVIKVMSLLTNTRKEWCQRTLNKHDYNLKEALSYFVDLYKLDKIPHDEIIGYEDESAAHSKSDYLPY